MPTKRNENNNHSIQVNNISNDICMRPFVGFCTTFPAFFFLFFHLFSVDSIHFYIDWNGKIRQEKWINKRKIYVFDVYVEPVAFTAIVRVIFLSRSLPVSQPASLCRASVSRRSEVLCEAQKTINIYVSIIMYAIILYRNQNATSEEKKNQRELELRHSDQPKWRTGRTAPQDEI